LLWIVSLPTADQGNQLASSSTLANALKGGFESFDKFFLSHKEAESWDDGTTALTLVVRGAVSSMRCILLLIDNNPLFFF